MATHHEEHAAPAHAAKPPPAPKDPTPPERAQALLSSLTEAHRHNAPITQTHLNELTAVVNHMTGNKAVVPGHDILDARGLPYHVLVSHPNTPNITMVTSAEEALGYVRSLPADVQARPHWVAADKALEDATKSVEGADISPAIRLFQAAVAADRKLVPPVAAKPKHEPKPQHA